jgi:hypothetical protein
MAVKLHLKIIHRLLHGNNLSGEIPDELQNLKKLEYIELGDNQLQGSIPSWLPHLPHLLHLSLGQNNISGHIPEAMGNQLISVRQFLWENKRYIVFEELYKNYDAWLGCFSHHLPHRRDQMWIRRNFPLTEVPWIVRSIMRYMKAENARLSVRINPAAAA